MGIEESLLFVCCLMSVQISWTVGDALNLNGYKIEISSCQEMTMSRPDGDSIELTMLGLYERDQHGNRIVPNGHELKLTDATAQNSTVNDPCSKPIPNSNTRGRVVDVETTFFDVPDQTIRVSYGVYFVTAAGQLILNTGQDKELQRVYPNNVKLTLTLEGWRWCAPCDGSSGESVTGAFLEVEMGLRLPAGAGVREVNVIHGPKELTLGNRMTLYLSNQVKRDSVWQKMPQNFLQISGEDPNRPNNYNITIRLPKFDSHIAYDPVFSLDEDDQEFHEDANEPSKVQCSNNNGDRTPIAGVSDLEPLFLCSLIPLILSVLRQF